jgi:hypothetical protein
MKRVSRLFMRPLRVNTTRCSALSSLFPVLYRTVAAMNDDENNNITRIAFRKVIQNKPLTDEESVALEDSWRKNSSFRKVSIKVLKSWYTWALTLISGAIGAEISGIINVVD